MVRAVGTEQSNTSVRVGGTLVFKLFRRLDAGENPELEVGRFLATRTTFRDMPMLRGSVTYVSPRGAPSTVGVLQDWIESRGDGWSHVLSLLRQRPPGRQELEEDLFGLGRTTAAFHAALASDPADAAFAPEPVTAADVEKWASGLQACAARVVDLVERGHAAWHDEAQRLGRSLVDRRREAGVLARAPGIDGARARFHKIRLHGDFHLGQTLRTADGFVLIDFEGEPARSLQERRLKHCALKDVAGMLRSFDYAVATADEQTRGRDADDLSGGLRSAFLDGYFSSTATACPFLPENRAVATAWIHFFEAEKALYEVEYELNNRPAWVHIPLRGLLQILRGRS
jgi:trehalose synthase-fused probable maltokinase